MPIANYGKNMNTTNIRPEDWVPAGVKELEPNADKVVRSNTNYSVIAGPGAGKTELLAQRACYLLQTGMCPYPHRILAISFKTDAAKNLKDRVAERCRKEDALRFDSLTFDAFSKGMLARFMSALPKLWQPTKNYEVLTKSRVLEYFIDDFSVDKSNASIKRELLAINRNSFERDWVLGSPLPPEGMQVKSAASLAASTWWQRCLHSGERSRLTFPMIGRLVELLLRTNPKICKALRVTYSHVFMDEFQDTTHVQYELVKTAFLNSPTILTAVGDNKQQIMRWAMALDDAFGKFENDFRAERIQLFRNYRSSPELVRIQNYLAPLIDSKCKAANSKSCKKISEDPCVIWDFQTREAEAEHLAKTISSSIREYGLTPRDFVLLVKQKADSYEPFLTMAFQQYGLKVRVTKQDLLAEPLTSIFITFLRFGSKDRAGVYWSDCFKILSSLRGIDSIDNRSGRLLQDELGDFHSSLRLRMGHLPYSTTRKINFLLRAVEEFIGQHSIKLFYPEYQQGEKYEELLKDITEQLRKSCEISEDWSTALDDFEGHDSVPIMTIHKSKGLEHHTVIFVGLDDTAWWSFNPQQPQESHSNFFVALSRAKQRLIFTYCAKRGNRSKISPLYKALLNAGVKTEIINCG